MDEVVLNVVINGQVVATVNGSYLASYSLDSFRDDILTETDSRYVSQADSTVDMSSMQAQINSLSTNDTTMGGQITTLQSQVSSLQGSSASVQVAGDMKTSPQTADHGMWLKCDGRAISRTTYSALYAVVGTSYGVGDGTTTFNLPNPQGRVLVYSGQGITAEHNLTGTNRVTGTLGGAETHTQTLAEIAAHQHAYIATTVVNDASLQLLGSGTRVTTQPSNLTQTAGAASPMNIMNPHLVVGSLFIYTG
jgi:microcystin-dependent protein